MKVSSFFSGCGGLDLGFHLAGFEILTANDIDTNVMETHKHNFPNTTFILDSISNIVATDLPKVDGFIGGPPCQSWSEAGAKRGISDERGKLFENYIDLISKVKPKFFIAENVAGITHKRNKKTLDNFINTFDSIGYDVSYELMNASDYGVAQDRKRLIIVGFRKDLNINYEFPLKSNTKLTLRDVINDLDTNPSKTERLSSKPTINGHEYLDLSYSSMYMSRNRVRTWDEPSFTIPASARHVTLHPSSPVMIKISREECRFVEGHEYRRLTVRECARIQSFPDDFVLKYTNIYNGYKMIGNAVPVELARLVAKSIFEKLEHVDGKENS